MRYDCRGSDWHAKIAYGIERASEGDTLVVGTDDARELAERALGRMRPGLTLRFKVEQLPSA